MTKLFSDPEAIAEDIIREVGTRLVVGLPLGLGKANHIANALYARAVADRSIDLTFFSALTLEKPQPSNLLERRFITPVIDRLFGGYPELAYAQAVRANALPPNVKVIEFFFLAGRWLHVPYAQQHYISANYTHASSYLLAQGLNVVAQLVAKRVIDGVTRYSLSCNSDTTLDVLRARSEGRAAFKLVGQVNSELPFMPGAGDLAAEEFGAVLDSQKTDFPLFAPPSEPISDTKYAIGLHAAGLVRDGGTLQIGIGQEGDALAQGLILRHRNDGQFQAIMKRLMPVPVQLSALETGPFENGLYGLSEMVFEAFLGLIEAGILKREVDGTVLHGAFFLGPKSFYRALREMSPDQIARIKMVPVSFTNELYGDEEVKRRARVEARFVNNTMMATLMGAVISDGLESGQVVSGVGGQYNFVAGLCAIGGALHSHARSHAAIRRQAAIEHSLELRPRDHTAASARYRRHGIRRGRHQGKIRRRRDRNDVADHRFPVSGRTQAAGQGRRKAPSKFRDSARLSRELSGPDSCGTSAGPRRGPVASVSIRQRFYRCRAAADPGLAIAAGGTALATALAWAIVAGIHHPYRCRRPRMLVAARARQAGNMVGTCLPRASRRSAGEKPAVGLRYGPASWRETESLQ